MKIRAAIQRILSMKPLSWELFLRFLQLCCFLLLCAVMLLIAYEDDRNRYELYIQARAINETAQTALLLAVILPVCLEDLTSSS